MVAECQGGHEAKVALGHRDGVEGAFGSAGGEFLGYGLDAHLERNFGGGFGLGEAQSHVVRAGLGGVKFPIAIGVGGPVPALDVAPVLTGQDDGVLVGRADVDARRGVVVRTRVADVIEPLLVLSQQVGEDFGLLLGEVVLFEGIVFHVIEFEVGAADEGLFAKAAGVQQFPALGAGGEVVVAYGHVASMGLDEEGAV